MMDNKNSNNPKSMPVFYLTSEAILKYFLNTSEDIDTLIMCKGSEVKLTTTDMNLYEALGSLEPSDGFRPQKLVKFMEQVSIEHAPKKILTHERVDELRKIALGR
jgi:hypothetical protein